MIVNSHVSRKRFPEITIFQNSTKQNETPDFEEKGVHEQHRHC